MNQRDSKWWALAGLPALLLILVPLLALLSRSDISKIQSVIGLDETRQAIFLSLRTTAIAILIVISIGFPLAYFIARSNSWLSKLADMISDLPIVLPPAAAGVALLAAFGRNGWFGQPLNSFGIQITFTSTAVIIAQCFVALPFFLRSAVEGLRKVDPDTLLAGAVDGAGRLQSLIRIVLPQCRLALLAGILLAWARALGEFGATLMFAGNFVGRTQTIPLALYAGFESDLDVAIALSVVLLALAVMVLIAARLAVRRET